MIAKLVVAKDPNGRLSDRFSNKDAAKELMKVAYDNFVGFQASSLEHNSGFSAREVAELVLKVKKWGEECRFSIDSIQISDVEGVETQLKSYRNALVVPVVASSSSESVSEVVLLRQEVTRLRAKVLRLKGKVADLRANSRSQTASVTVSYKKPSSFIGKR